MAYLNTPPAGPSGDPLAVLTARLAQSERRVARERMARLAAEMIAERGLRDLYESQQWLALLQRITDGANRDGDVRTALHLAVTEVCRHMGWAFGNVYLRAGDAVAGCDTWYAPDPEGIAAFVEVSRRYRFDAGAGLPGRVLTDVRPHWVEDVTQDANFLRAAVAAGCGIHAGCAFPVLVGEEVAAVLEFFSRQRLLPDDRLMAIMSQIGTQLGRVIERDRARRALVHDALHDPMTGLPNRTLLTDRLHAAFARAAGDPAARIAVMVVDLDGFKAINDTQGHRAGDAALVEAAGRLCRCLEAAVAGERAAGRAIDATLARMGGDEFTVLIDASDIGVTDRIAAAMHLCLAVADDARNPMTASIGIAYNQGSYAEPDQLLQDADLAMYEAKGGGRNRTVTLSDSMGLRLRQRMALEQQLRHAVLHDEFVLHYQPIVSMADGNRICGFEALVRWQHPVRGLLHPVDFVDVLEETGLILPAGDWVLRAACRAMAAWHRIGAGDGAFISINISPVQFLQPDFARRVRQVLVETGIDPATVRLEVTESVAIRDAARTRVVIEEIRSWGVGTSLDDFGTGYSSLSHLQNLPFDTLKVDRSFVTAMTSTGTGRGIVRAILDLATTMGMKVIAEGIETEQQAMVLRSLGCVLGQGYLYGRPMDAVRAEAAIVARSAQGDSVVSRPSHHRTQRGMPWWPGGSGPC